MGRRFRVLAITVVFVAAAGLVWAGTPATEAQPKAPAPDYHHQHGRALAGTVSSVDAKAKTFVVKDAKGVERTVAWTEATNVKGGTLAAGEKVEVRFMRKEGERIATAIAIDKS